MGDASVIAANRQPLWSELLRFGRTEVLQRVGENLENIHESTVTLPLEVWSQIRYSCYRWIATRFGYKVRTKYFECIYAFVEKYFSQSIVGFEPANNIF